MALIDTSHAQRFHIPHEPDEWMEIRPATAREMAKLSDESIPVDERSWKLINWVVTAWSYEAELTPENLDKLDAQTFEWLNDRIVEVAGLRDEVEKKVSVTDSSPGPSRNGASSRKKSATS